VDAARFALAAFFGGSSAWTIPVVTASVPTTEPMAFAAFWRIPSCVAAFCSGAVFFLGMNPAYSKPDARRSRLKIPDFGCRRRAGFRRFPLRVYVFAKANLYLFGVPDGRLVVVHSVIRQSTSGELVGTTYDQAGAVVPNATIVANHASTGASVKAAPGMLANGGRNTEHLNPTDDIDLSILKRVNLTERFKLELAGRFVNVLNHPQYIGDRLSGVMSKGYTGTQVRNFLNPADTSFYRPDLVFSSNPRMTTISAKTIF
jgi:hypothetical protein